MSIGPDNAWKGHGVLFWIMVFGFPPAAFLLSWGLHEIAIRHMHYSVGALIALVQLMAVAWLAGIFERPVLLPPKSGLDEAIAAKLKVHEFVRDISTSAAAALVLITLFAWLSYALVQLGLGTPMDGSLVTYGNLIKAYGWHLVDLIPLMHVEKSLGLSAPAVEFQGWAMGAPILIFRVLVGVVAFTGIRRAWLRFVPSEANGGNQD
jgi:hypothetical protein